MLDDWTTKGTEKFYKRNELVIFTKDGRSAKGYAINKKLKEAKKWARKQ